jgi:glycosyltransferase involved in cell wall biosynthesis
VCYGGDAVHRREVVQGVGDERSGLDPARVKFLGLIPPRELARLFQITDCHVYLTAPFVLSWSLLNALACGAPVVASDTPVREVVEHNRTGLLTNFFDDDALARTIERVIDDPDGRRELGEAGVRLVAERYSTEVCLPRLVRLFERSAAPSEVHVTSSGADSGPSPARSAAVL